MNFLFIYIYIYIYIIQSSSKNYLQYVEYTFFQDFFFFFCAFILMHDACLSSAHTKLFLIFQACKEFDTLSTIKFPWNNEIGQRWHEHYDAFGTFKHHYVPWWMVNILIKCLTLRHNLFCRRKKMGPRWSMRLKPTIEIKNKLNNLWHDVYWLTNVFK